MVEYPSENENNRINVKDNRYAMDKDHSAGAGVGRSAVDDLSEIVHSKLESSLQHHICKQNTRSHVDSSNADGGGISENMVEHSRASDVKDAMDEDNPSGAGVERSEVDDHSEYVNNTLIVIDDDDLMKGEAMEVHNALVVCGGASNVSEVLEVLAYYDNNYDNNYDKDYDIDNN